MDGVGRQKSGYGGFLKVLGEKSYPSANGGADEDTPTALGHGDDYNNDSKEDENMLVHGVEEYNGDGKEGDGPIQIDDDTKRSVEEIALTGGRYERRMSNGAGGITFHQNFNDNGSRKEPTHQEAITLPQSTHTLLFTEKVPSLPFAFAFIIYGISATCLILALIDNLDGSTAQNPLNVPANISASVRVAQYFSIIVAVLMEEEIPTALYLLRMIPKSSLESRLGLSYGRFVMSAICRLSIGLLFLVNVFLVVVQSRRVLDMFYDMVSIRDV